MHDEQGTRVADDLGFQIGWWDAPTWLTDDGSLGMDTFNAHCRCGRHLTGDPGRVAALLRAAVGNKIRRLQAPEDVLFSKDEYVAAQVAIADTYRTGAARNVQYAEQVARRAPRM